MSTRSKLLLLALSAFSLTSPTPLFAEEGEKVVTHREQSVFIDPPAVVFENLAIDQVVTSPFNVKMAGTGILVVPADATKELPTFPINYSKLNEPLAGHFHLIIDGTYIEEGVVIPNDDKHLHYGKGQTEATISLKPGKHTLTLQFGDAIHRSFGQPLSVTVPITVK